uniref:Uncharacterized protein n=1 Tax=Anguilla anguilla TaxID=7936 RepID=A0A0E9SH59_ANGAN
MCNYESTHTTFVNYNCTASDRFLDLSMIS